MAEPKMSWLKPSANAWWCQRRVHQLQPGTNPAKTQSSNRPAGISDTEMARRLKAVQAAKAREAEDSATRAAEEENRQKERERRRAEQAEKEREQREAEEIARKKS